MDVLVLCIDRDDDLGRKAGVKSPIIGRASNLEAAVRLGIADPEDSDMNTIFGGIKVYDELRSLGRSVEIASLTGDIKVGLISDTRLGEQLEELLQRIKPSGVIVVSDGAEDEAIMPLIQSRVRVNGVRRVLVKQSPNLESTYYLLKHIFRDPKISHTIFTPIGLTLLVYSIFSFLGHSEGAWASIGGVLGLYMLFRGMGLDDFLDDAKVTLRKSLYAGKITFITYLLAAMLIVIATVQGAAMVWYSYSEGYWNGYLTLIMIFVNNSVWWYVAAGICANLGKIIDMLLEGTRDARTFSSPFFLFAAGLIFWSSSVFILASTIPNFEVTTVRAIQYLAFSAMAAILIALIGVKLMNYIAKVSGKPAPSSVPALPEDTTGKGAFRGVP
jgi:putative membrane protein